jgi:hypothetical protein
VQDSDGEIEMETGVGFQRHWRGCVVAVDQDLFKAMFCVFGRDMRNSPFVFATIPLFELSERERQFVTTGALFDWKRGRNDDGSRLSDFGFDKGKSANAKGDVVLKNGGFSDIA